MPIEEIGKKILQEAEGKAKAIDKEGQAEAAKILDEAKSKAAGIRKAAKASAEEDAKRLLAQKRSSVELDIARKELEEQDKAVGNAMQALKKEVIKELSSKHYKELSKAAFTTFAEAVPEYEIRVKAGKNVEKAISGSYKVERSQSPDEFLIMSKDGKIRLDASAGKVVEMNEIAIKNILAKKMFKKEKHAKKKG